MLVSTEGIVLRRTLYGDTSIITSILTQEKGKISIIAKGARRPKNPIASLLEPPNILNLQFYHKETRNIQILKEASFSQRLSGIRNQLEKIHYALSIVEIVEKTSRDNEILPIIYRLTNRCLCALNSQHTKDDTLFIFFLLQLSIRSGFMPDLSICCHCGSELSPAALDLVSGELVCDKCRLQESPLISEESLELLRLLVHTNIDDLGSLVCEKYHTIELIAFLNSFAKIHLEGMKYIKSLNLLQELFDGSL